MMAKLIMKILIVLLVFAIASEIIGTAHGCNRNQYCRNDSWCCDECTPCLNSVCSCEDPTTPAPTTETPTTPSPEKPNNCPNILEYLRNQLQLNGTNILESTKNRRPIWAGLGGQLRAQLS